MSWSMLGAGSAGGQKFFLQDNLKGTFKWENGKWILAPRQGKHSSRGVRAGQAATQARSTQGQPWSRAGSCAAPARAPCPAASPAPWPWHTVPQPRHPCPRAPHSQTVCWPWSVTSAPLSAKNQRSALVFLEEALTPPQLFSQNSPESQCQNPHRSPWANVLNSSYYWLRNARLGKRRRGRKNMHDFLIYVTMNNFREDTWTRQTVFQRTSR